MRQESPGSPCCAKSTLKICNLLEVIIYRDIQFVWTQSPRYIKMMINNGFEPTLVQVPFVVLGSLETAPSLKINIVGYSKYDRR